MPPCRHVYDWFFSGSLVVALAACLLATDWRQNRQSRPRRLEPISDYCARSIRSADEPPFTVCGPPGWQCFVGGGYPSDVGDEHDCDILPYLMRLAAPGGPEVAAEEVFLDLGSNAGMCSYLMLSKGYRAITMEEDEKYHPWIRATIAANEGWAERSQVLQKMVGERLPGTEQVPLDALIPPPTAIRLWKLDVDGMEVTVLRSFRKALAAGRVDVIQFELINDEVDGQKMEVFETIQSHGYHLFAAFAPDREGGFNDMDEDLLEPCRKLQKTISRFGLADVSSAWTDLPDVPDEEEAVLHAEEAARYSYGSQRAAHFEFVPFCASREPAHVGPGLCWMQYVAVREGSHAAQSPEFSREAQDCSTGRTDAKAFVSSVKRRLKQAVSTGRARAGRRVEPLFPDPRERLNVISDTSIAAALILPLIIVGWCLVVPCMRMARRSH